MWDTKVHYNYWRPITAINLGDTDGNPNTEVDTGWIPFIQGSHFPPPSPLPPTPPPPSQTPPYPDYTSGANGLSGAVTTMLQLYFDTDWVPFEIYKEGRKLGARVATHTFQNALKPVWPPKNPNGDAHDHDHDWKDRD